MFAMAIEEFVTTIIGMIATFLLGFLASQLKKHSKTEKARIEIERALARQMIFQAYEDYIINGEHLTIARYDEIMEVGEAYRTLKGNGTAKAYLEALEHQKPYMVTD